MDSPALRRRRGRTSINRRSLVLFQGPIQRQAERKVEAFSRMRASRGMEPSDIAVLCCIHRPSQFHEEPGHLPQAFESKVAAIFRMRVFPHSLVGLQ